MNSFDKLMLSCEETILAHTEQIRKIRSMLGIYDDFIKLVDKESNDLINIKREFSFIGQLIIPTLELSVILKNLVSAKTDWEKVFFIKHSYLIIFESLKLIKPDKGSNIIEETIRKHNLRDLKKEWQKISNNIQWFKNNHYKDIENVRHYTAAHVDKNFQKYYDTIYQLDGDVAGQIIKEYMDLLQSILDLSSRVMTQQPTTNLYKGIEQKERQILDKINNSSINENDKKKIIEFINRNRKQNQK